MFPIIEPIIMTNTVGREGLRSAELNRTDANLE